LALADATALDSPRANGVSRLRQSGWMKSRGTLILNRRASSALPDAPLLQAGVFSVGHTQIPRTDNEVLSLSSGSMSGQAGSLGLDLDVRLCG